MISFFYLTANDESFKSSGFKMEYHLGSLVSMETLTHFISFDE